MIYEGRGPGIVSGATKHYNFKTESICYTGYGGKKLPEVALISITEVIEDIQARYGGRLWLKGHQDLAATSCPGSELYAWLKNGCVIYEGNPSTIDFEGIARYLRALGAGLDDAPLSRRRRSRGQLVQLTPVVGQVFFLGGVLRRGWLPRSFEEHCMTAEAVPASGLSCPLDQLVEGRKALLENA